MTCGRRLQTQINLKESKHNPPYTHPSKHEEVVITRTRIGLSRLTHLIPQI